MRVITELVGDLADIYSPEKTGRLAARLLDAAGPGRRREVRTVTGGSGPVFRVPVDIARAAGFINEPANAGNSSGSEATTDDAAGAAPAPEKKTPARKATTRKAPAKAPTGGKDSEAGYVE